MRKPQRILAKLAMALVAILITLVVVELCLLVVSPHAGMGAARELSHFRKDSDLTNRFTIDPAFGFRPKLGTDLYNEYGTLTNSYPVEKRPGIRRILFMGDSVTARGHLVDAIRKLYPSVNYEFWNAGVESFNTVQEVAYYKTYNVMLEPDHVILSFHMNDFETTPVVFMDGCGRLTVYAPNMPGRAIIPWLFQYSRLYRLYLGATRGGVHDTESIVRETYRSLKELKRMLSDKGIRFTVLVLPLCKPFTKWSEDEKSSHQVILDMLEGLKIRHFDLLDGMEQAINAGVTPCEGPGDDWHPSRKAASYMAESLKGKLLDQNPGKGFKDTTTQDDESDMSSRDVVIP